MITETAAAGDASSVAAVGEQMRARAAAGARPAFDRGDVERLRVADRASTLSSWMSAVTSGRAEHAIGSLTGTQDPPGDPAAMPAPSARYVDAAGQPTLPAVAYRGPLFRDGARPEDVRQGYLGDCYVATAAASIAQAQPGLLERLIKDNGDGTYTVTFKQQAGWGEPYRDVPVTVDGKLYEAKSDRPAFGISGEPTSRDQMELWWPIFEKAYAKFRGGYDAIGSGGDAKHVLESVLGRPGNKDLISLHSRDTNWQTIRRAIDERRPICAGTTWDTLLAPFTNSGLRPQHAYSVLGYQERDGEKYVQLRNPWGNFEPTADGVDDGVFWLKFDDFIDRFQDLNTVD